MRRWFWEAQLYTESVVDALHDALSRRAWVCSYNHRFRKFDNGICWYRFYVKIAGRWRTPGGLWFRLPDSGATGVHRWPMVRYLRPDEAKGPIRPRHQA